MSNLLGGLQGTAYVGTNANQPPNIFFEQRNPTQYDTSASVGDIWININNIPADVTLWMLASLAGNDTAIGQVALWRLLVFNPLTPGDVDFLKGNLGGNVPPDITNVINVVGDTNTIFITGNPGANTLTASVQSTTTARQILMSAGATNNPATYSTARYPATTSTNDVLISSGANNITGLAFNGAASRYLSNIGGSPSWHQVDLTNGVTGILPLANGGTDASGLADPWGVVYYDGTRLVTTTAGTALQAVVSQGGGGMPPVFADIVNSVIGAANQIRTSSATGDVLLNLSSTLIAPGSLEVINTFTVDAGNVTITPFSNIPNVQSVVISNGVGVLDALNAGANGTVLTSDGTNLSWQAAGGGGGVNSVHGTANQIIAAPNVNNVVVSIPTTFIAPGSIASTTTVTAGTGLTVTTGDITVTAGNLNMPNTNVSGTQGIILFGGQAFISNFGTSNTYVGENAGNVGSANLNTAVGAGALLGLASGSGNNIAVGYNALHRMASGTQNIAIGSSAAFNYTTNENSNIIIGNNNGVLGESNTIRLGVNGGGIGQQNRCFVAGIANVAVANTEMVTINSVTGQMGSQPVPGGSVTSTNFMAYQSGTINNITGNGETITLGATGGGGAIFTQVFNNGGGVFAPGNGAGTAMSYTVPATGYYKFEITVMGNNASTIQQTLSIVTPSQTVSEIRCLNAATNPPGSNSAITISALAFMMNATAVTFTYQAIGSGSTLSGISGGNAPIKTWVQGFRLS